jgi:hypothetical protein
MKRNGLCILLLLSVLLGCSQAGNDSNTDDPIPLWPGWYKYSTNVPGTHTTYLEYTPESGRDTSYPLRAGTEEVEYSSEYLESVGEALNFYFLRDTLTPSTTFEYLEYRYILLPDWAQPEDIF